jgi:protein SCO1/2
MEYLLGLGDPELANMSNEFIHTEYVALVDRDRQIRGFYDATKKEAINKMRKDIDLLLSEY